MGYSMRARTHTHTHTHTHALTLSLHTHTQMRRRDKMIFSEKVCILDQSSEPVNS